MCLQLSAQTIRGDATQDWLGHMVQHCTQSTKNTKRKMIKNVLRLGKRGSRRAFDIQSHSSKKNQNIVLPVSSPSTHLTINIIVSRSVHTQASPPIMLYCTHVYNTVRVSFQVLGRL